MLAGNLLSNALAVHGKYITLPAFKWVSNVRALKDKRSTAPKRPKKLKGHCRISAAASHVASENNNFVRSGSSLGVCEQGAKSLLISRGLAQPVPAMKVVNGVTVITWDKNNGVQMPIRGETFPIMPHSECLRDPDAEPDGMAFIQLDTQRNRQKKSGQSGYQDGTGGHPSILCKHNKPTRTI